MSDVMLIPLGVGDAFTAIHYTSSLLLGVDDQWLLIDCPHPIRKMLREASQRAGIEPALDINRLHASVVTHLHADHCCGIEDLGYYSYFALRRRATILMHPECSVNLWDGLLSAGMNPMYGSIQPPSNASKLADYFDLIDLDTTHEINSGPFSIECRRTVHGVPTYALRISTSGRVIGLSSDTAYDPELIEWLSPADLIVHEVTSLDESEVHTPYRRLAALPAALRERIRLTHYSDDFDIDASVIEPLREGRIYRV
jgi:ribonuclease BN (tRNA processing enzyme)